MRSPGGRKGAGLVKKNFRVPALGVETTQNAGKKIAKPGRKYRSRRRTGKVGEGFTKIGSTDLPRGGGHGVKCMTIRPAERWERFLPITSCGGTGIPIGGLV